jgi:hypothetical protein
LVLKLRLTLALIPDVFLRVALDIIASPVMSRVLAGWLLLNRHGIRS